MSIKYLSNCTVPPLMRLHHSMPQNGLTDMIQNTGSGTLGSKLFDNLSNRSSPKGLRCNLNYSKDRVSQTTKCLPVSVSTISCPSDNSPAIAEIGLAVKPLTVNTPNPSDALSTVSVNKGVHYISDDSEDVPTHHHLNAERKEDDVESSEAVNIWSASESVDDRGIPNDTDGMVKLPGDNGASGKEMEMANSAEVTSKVVVQAMPVLEFGNITALEQCISDSSISLSERESKKSREHESRRRRMREQAELRASLKMQLDSDDDISPYKPTMCYKMKRMMRRNHEMNFHIRPGDGVRLSSIDCIASAVENASPVLLRILHYILFGTYGVCNNEYSVSQTKSNILHFSGFPFGENSEIFYKTRQCLLRIPFPMLSGIYLILLQKLPKNRDEYAVDKLLTFLLKPEVIHPHLIQKIKPEVEVEDHDEDQFSIWKERALTGPRLIVAVERLSVRDIERQVQELRSEADSKRFKDKDDSPVKEYLKPDSLETRPGLKLRLLPNIAVKVHEARRRIINLLHILLFGKPGSDDVNRQNILEFSGFGTLRKQLMKRKFTFLKKLRNKELTQICDIFCVRAKSSNKTEKVWKLLQYLQAPTHRKNIKRSTRDMASHSTSKVKPSHKALKTTTPKRPIEKLGDIENIRSQVECSSPQDLLELNDLLFMKPCDSLEIHQKILEFTPFLCDESSSEFLYRKTLLYYMNFGIIRKIAQLLDISDWEEYSSPQELGKNILKFLIDLKLPVKVHKKPKSTPSQPDQRPHILKVHRLESRRNENSCNGNERNNGEFGSPSSVLYNSAYSSVKFPEGFHEKKSLQDDSNSTVVVHRISESSYSWTDLKNNVPLTVSEANSDESISLHDFVHHPTERQLEEAIGTIIKTNPSSLTIGDLINKVFHCYPKFNLGYRIDFIKAKALEIVKSCQG